MIEGERWYLRERGKILFTKDFEKGVSLIIGKSLYARGKSV